MNPKYKFEVYDGEEWVPHNIEIFNTAQEAKTRGIEMGFEYVRVVEAK